MVNMFGLDDKYVQNIEQKFNLKRNIAKEREKELFSIFNEALTDEETFVLKFLFAYMPLNDMADNNGEFFLNHVRKILSIRDMMPWGKKIPGNAFIHFVLPYRINNENIENFVDVIFDELYIRVKDLSMYDAISEINHWCHEKATYIGSDIRTISPLTLMRTAIGRCGEESTLLVAALRSLCIPARQCYTPRWAHCDSNHAWVEAWAEDDWYFLGACEPEPKLNMGWFSGPARRAMLVNTRVAGNYPGPEEITLAHEWFTEINLLNNYAPNKTITVKVVDEEEEPVQGATVNFEVYNTGQFYPILKLITDSNGEATVTTGYGDIMLYAYKGNHWGFNKISVKDGEKFEVLLSSKLPEDGVLEFKMIPPPERQEAETQATEEERKINDFRLKEEDRIRTTFENTFVSEAHAKQLAAELKLPEDRVWKVLKNAKGNSHEIAEFLKEETQKFGLWPLKLLESLKEKDPTDTFRPVLRDHLIYSLSLKDNYPEEIFIPYIMCPRVNFEMLGSYKEFFQGSFTEEAIKSFNSNPASLVKWVKTNIEVINDCNYYIGYAAPKGSFELKKADTPSRHILFVAMARSFGIPARLEPSDKRPQYLENGQWKDADFEKVVDEISHRPTGTIKLKLASAETQKPEYYGNFSIARFEDGVFKTLDYYEKEFSFFEEGIEVIEGKYRITSAVRLTDCSVLVRFAFFTVKENENNTVELIYLEENSELNIYGQLPENYEMIAMDGRKESINENLKEKGAVVVFIDPDREPTKHILRELKELAYEFNNWGGKIYLIIEEDKLTSSFNPSSYKELPLNTTFAVDKDYAKFDSLAKALNNYIPKKYPVVFALGSNGDITYKSVGYKLGIASDLVKILKY